MVNKNSEKEEESYILCTSMPICDLYFPQRKEYIPPWVNGMISYPPLGICVAGILTTVKDNENTL